MKRKMSEIMKDAYMEDLMNLAPVEVDEAAIKRRTFDKLGITPEVAENTPKSQQNTTPFVRSVNGGRPRRRALRVTVISVMLVLALTTVVYAATVIYRMIQQRVGYFEPNSTIQTPVSGPTYHGALAMDIEQYNASVGLGVTDNGKTVTLDTIAVDDNFINAFFTVAYEGPIDLDSILEGPYPAYHKLLYATPWFTLQVDGKEMDAGFTTQDEYDPYMTDDRTIKMMVRWVAPTILPDTFEISLHGEEYSTVTGDSSGPIGTFHFDITVDKSASAVATRAAEPGVYDLGNRVLDLNKLAVTPFGAVLSVNGHWDGNELNPAPHYLMPGEFYITDNQGNVLNSFWNNTISSGSAYYAIELIGGAPDAESITLTPIKQKDNWDDQETRTYSVADIGTKIEVDSLGGYYLEDYIIEGNRVSLVLRPYGQCNYAAGGIVINDDPVTLVGDRSGLINEQIDRKTGLLTYSVDFYGASPEELQAISTFTVVYGGDFELDEAAAITLPLAPATH